MTQCAMAPDEAGFRSLMARFATGVTVVTSVGSGGPAGMTANAVASLSLDPLLVMVGFDADGSPLLLLSNLAQHSKNIAADPRVSLLFDGTRGLEDPLTGPRLTVLGRAAPCTGADAIERYVAVHPTARAYLGFGDFRLYRIEVDRGHLGLQPFEFARVEVQVTEATHGFSAQLGIGVLQLEEAPVVLHRLGGVGIGRSVLVHVHLLGGEIADGLRWIPGLGGHLSAGAEAGERHTCGSHCATQT